MMRLDELKAKAPCLLRLKPVIDPVVKKEIVSNDKYKKWQDMIDEGISVSEIARIEGCHYTSVLRKIKMPKDDEVITFAKLRLMIQQDEKLKECIVRANGKPKFKLVPIEKDETNG